MSDTLNQNLSANELNILDPTHLSQIAGSRPELKYKWNITNLDVTNRPLSGTVIRVSVCVSENGDISTLNNVRFCVDLNEPNVDSFTPLEQITEEMIVNWVVRQIGNYGVKMWEDSLEKQLEISSIQSITPSWVTLNTFNPTPTEFENHANINTSIPPAVIEGQDASIINSPSSEGVHIPDVGEPVIFDPNTPDP